MYKRTLKLPTSKSLFLFGPRGTGKSTFLKTNYPKAVYLDLLESELFQELLAHPQRLSQFFGGSKSKTIVIDEVQKIPELLNEVHRLIEKDKLQFILTGSSARKLKKSTTNMLAGRALEYRFFPLTAEELGADFNLKNSLQFGHLPSIFSEENPKKYLKSYISSYLKEEVQQERLTRNLAAFSRFMETATFSQAQLLNVSEVARECFVERKVVEDYFLILEDLLMSIRLPVFSKKAKRKLVTHLKFFYFDVGIFRSLRPRGPLDSDDSIDGLALETLVLQEIRACNSYYDLEYQIFFWRTQSGQEVDFILYGSKGLKAIEVKLSSRIRDDDLKGLFAFKADYPDAECVLIYGGLRPLKIKDILLIPAVDFFKNIKKYLT
jgi:predicted AAA+ superfamily ATPase